MSDKKTKTRAAEMARHTRAGTAPEYAVLLGLIVAVAIAAAATLLSRVADTTGNIRQAVAGVVTDKPPSSPGRLDGDAPTAQTGRLHGDRAAAQHKPSDHR